MQDALALEPLFLIHLACSFAMMGVIWIVQLVHYPAFSYIDEQQYSTFQHDHMNRISFVVVPFMLGELITAALLAWQMPEMRFLWINLLMIVFLWVYTFLVSARIHQNLTGRKDARLIDRLILTNWPRTLVWTAHSLGLLVFSTNLL